MKYLILFYSFSCALVICAHTASAQSISADTNEIDLNQKNIKKWSQIIDITFNTDNSSTSDTQKSYGTELWYFLTYKLNNTYRVRLWMDVTKNLVDTYEERLKDSKITFSRAGWDITSKLRVSPSISLVLPTGENSKRNEELNFGLDFNTSFSYKLSNKIRLGYLPRVTKNFHEYTVSRSNRLNKEYRFVQFMSAGYSFSDKWYAESAFIYVNSWAYTGTRQDPGYLTNFELGYSPLGNLTVATGVLTGGSIFDRQNGPDKSIEVFNKNESTLYGKFSLRY